MAKDIFRKVQEQLDQYSLGFPATESGIEIEILKKLFSTDDAEMFHNLSPKLETPEDIASRLGKKPQDVAEKLADMAARGLVFRLKKNESIRYGAIPFIHGLYEFQVKNLKRDFSEMVGQYFEEGLDTAMQDGLDHFLRPIPVQQSIDVTHNVASYDDAVQILKTKSRIVITDCICRKRTEIVEEGCGKPMEACFMFGSMGQYYLDHGMGREIQFAEAIDILTECREAGLVIQPATSQNPAGMCNCCGDCCGVLKALNKHPRPVDIVFSNHFATVDSEECTGCGTCEDRCQMKAITMDDDDLAVINLDRCIGCGLCVTTCPAEALRLTPKPEDQHKIPPANSLEQMLAMAQKRGVL